MRINTIRRHHNYTEDHFSFNLSGTGDGHHLSGNGKVFAFNRGEGHTGIFAYDDEEEIIVYSNGDGNGRGDEDGAYDI